MKYDMSNLFTVVIMCYRVSTVSLLQANHKEVFALYLSCYTQMVMNTFPFTETLRTSRVSNLDEIKFCSLLYSSHLPAPPFMTPVSKLDVRGSIFIIILVLFISVPSFVDC
jgi:hypothetical protein